MQENDLNETENTRMTSALSTMQFNVPFADLDSMKEGIKLWITSPRPAESTPAITGEKYASYTRHRSVLR